MQCPCVYCLCLTGRVSFSTQVSCAITHHSQLAKDIDPYLKSKLYVEDPVTENWYSFYQMGCVNLESECTTEINVNFYKSRT